MKSEMRTGAGIAMALTAIAACASDNMGAQGGTNGTHFPGQRNLGSPAPHVAQEEFTVVQADGDAQTLLSQIGIVSNVPAEVIVMKVTHALFQGDQSVSGCFVGPMGSNGSIALHEKDRLDVSWMPVNLTELPDGIYYQQTAIQGDIGSYESGGSAHPPRSDAFLAGTGRPFAVSDGNLRVASIEEYREAYAQPEGPEEDPAVLEPTGGEGASRDGAPTNCEPSDVAVTANVTPAS